ncbi:component of SufBCD complex [Roseivivax halodurans JCM 10272]|uniref:Component of SufBCD complex n=1 Tax=Roseivivax halodurans JCM 10272 TaxID=1449350 RepID=X7EGR4_9RHOB|nr:hypothetical protein [Roseivivax halodurans]ETX14298.1 component of SufBCD complex [Roseivivax halodurans JCM 10272]
MDVYAKVFEVIDMRSFSNLWFWIALAVMWSTASHWILGVPYDMVSRAGRLGGAAQKDFEDLARINVTRILQIAEEAGLLLAAGGSFLLTMLGVLGFGFGVEIAQAVFLLGLPMALIGLLSVRTARRIRARGIAGPELRGTFTRHRMVIQGIGMVSVLVTTLWGMYMNFVLGPFGS